ncbi:hypothetical protein Ddye_029622 [Dipteronia dyeriana]|uniref:Uncharacterized protein n=1 Tax=Dipteronia dyeriana TaxID=168575 RepID=A0AAD9WLW5_9ROSI|nr:hypothetical protein Ddye_029622 [Dipteronia dyeriana]
MKTSFGNQWKKVSALMMRLSFGNQWKNPIEVSALIRRMRNHTTQDPNLSSSLELKKPNPISCLKNPMEVSALVRRMMHHTPRDCNLTKLLLGRPPIDQGK